jgi:hypothetical protein
MEYSECYVLSLEHYIKCFSYCKTIKSDRVGGKILTRTDSQGYVLAVNSEKIVKEGRLSRFTKLFSQDNANADRTSRRASKAGAGIRPVA